MLATDTKTESNSMATRHLLILIVVLMIISGSVWYRDYDTKTPGNGEVDNSTPTFSLPDLYSNETIDSSAWHGQIWLLNVWASWCAPCAIEHPRIQELASNSDLLVVGLNYQDVAADARDWLAEKGNPYARVVQDNQGLLADKWGIQAVPQTYLIGRNGHIRYEKIGPITAEDVEKILSLLGN